MPKGPTGKKRIGTLAEFFAASPLRGSGLTAARRAPSPTSKKARFDYRLENDPRFLRRIEEARNDLRAGREVRLNRHPREGGGPIVK